MLSKQDHDKYLEEFKKYSKFITSSKDEAKAFLIRVGIHTPEGKLFENYNINNTESENGKN